MTAPVLAVNVIPVPLGMPALATRTTTELLKEETEAAEPPRIAATIALPPPNRPVPLTVTRVPNWPWLGDAPLITPVVMYCQLLGMLSSDPVLPRPTMLPTADAALACACTKITELLALTMTALTPPRVMLYRLAAPPSRLRPLMVTMVPS